MQDKTCSSRRTAIKRGGQWLSAVALSSLAVFAAQAADNQAIVEAARKEAAAGPFVIMVSSPKSEQAQRRIMEAFQKRFGIDVNWEWTPLTSTVSAPRVHQQATAGLAVPSAIGGYGYNTYENWFARNGLDAEVDWVGDFGEMFPKIKAAAVDGVLPSYRKRMLRQWDVQYVMVYNKNLVKAGEVPKDIWELTEPKWQGRFAMANNTPPPLDILAVDIGVDKAVELTNKLIANKPRFKPGPPAVVGAISNGEVALGVSGYTALAEAQKRKGAPIEWAPLATMPVGPLFMFMLKGAPQPNLGKLFLAWLATEGAEIQEKEEYLSLFHDPDSATTQKIKAMMPDVKVVEVRTEEQLRQSEVAAKQIMSAVASVAGK
ncbi:ABC transporter substrate-binding protein [Bordetella bronchiseptica]|uniref:Iron ABC transporter substrate-binding protein n=1 Tax=Bordetella genomosp. 6 TaxID=463024 RepID=A0ABX4FFN8_9BORD|nr:MULTISPECIES: extracellular solute-binding protein [Bordetella]KCV63946.1 ABC transporter, solute-binding protein [Bordetella bronchiseptica 99-R-0433]MBN3267111.1 iron ABC transporter substrate-binding protein [Bordetella bronchiseptica]OZI80302.1 iron ABC transporter substrate-binding protein [Bordetella genomosp. 6]